MVVSYVNLIDFICANAWMKFEREIIFARVHNVVCFFSGFEKWAQDKHSYIKNEIEVSLMRKRSLTKYP